MANLLWGKVYYQDTFAGYLQKEPGERYTFTYDLTYLNSKNPAIAYTLPLQETPHITENALPPFFDNLVAEGWLEQAQSRLLGKRICSRFELLLAFGTQCVGSVSVIDPDPAKLYNDRLDQDDPMNIAVLKNKASISGVQPKFFLVKDKKGFHAAGSLEFSTHIAKLPSASHPDVVFIEYLTLQACRALMPDDTFVEAQMLSIGELAENVLVLKRFDRGKNNTKIHFEEFNQLLGLQSQQKYHGSYRDMARFIDDSEQCVAADKYRLFKRILMAIITGNTDIHFKNFAMFHTDAGLRFTPNYDQVAAALYPPYRYMALEIDGVAERVIGKLKPKQIIALGEEFGFAHEVIAMAVYELAECLDAAKESVSASVHGTQELKDQLIQLMEKRWNGTFHLIGQQLSRKR